MKHLFLQGRDGRGDDIESPHADGPKAYQASSLIGLAFPRRRVEGTSWERISSRGDLLIEALKYPHCHPSQGRDYRHAEIPSGLACRLALLSLQTMAVIQKTPEISLTHTGGSRKGQALTYVDWVQSLGFVKNGKNLHNFQRQLLNLASCTITIVPWNPEQRAKVRLFRGQLFDELELQYTTLQPSLFPTKIKLSRKFYERCLDDQAVPIPREAVLQLRSASHFDAYVFLVKLLPSLRGDGLLLTWEDLRDRLGTPGSKVNVFAYNFRKSLTKALSLYPEARKKVQVIDGKGVHFRWAPSASLTKAEREVAFRI